LSCLALQPPHVTPAARSDGRRARFALAAPANDVPAARTRVLVSAREASEDEGDRAMSRYAEGHDGSFAAVHHALADRLRGFLLRLCRSESVADDLVQETFLRIHRARGSFAAGARLVPWSYAIARNVWIDHTRSPSKTREKVAAGEDDPGIDAPTGPDADGEQVAIARDLARAVERTLAKLPPNQREAFVLIRYEGMSVADAAEVLGATEGAVKLRAFHAYEALRAELGAMGVDSRKRGTS
jgi:RNA polymerase sigma-70 factor (ECF subfamily)